jgi:Bifunctional DNA primase/polymerase, N-terminal/Primase C terminal 1 (PriCT-1)
MQGATMSDEAKRGSSNLECALNYARRGLPVFPIWPVLPMLAPYTGFMCGCGSLRCKDQGKHPIGRLAPKGLTDATINPQKLSHWWASRHDANLAVATEGLIVVDVDPRKNGFDTMEKLVEKYGELPHTWRVVSGGGGRHLYFNDPTDGQIRCKNDALGQGVDVKASGGYVVAPPSNHISGGAYAWQEGHSPDEAPLANPPDWIIETIQKAQATSAKSPFDWKEAATNIIAGQRNSSITRLTGYLLRKWIDPRVTLEIVRCFNAVRCHPPLDDPELIKIVRSICSKELRRRGEA